MTLLHPAYDIAAWLLLAAILLTFGALVWNEMRT